MTDEYIPRLYTKEHGLPDNEVREILQTRDGYLWVVTQQGLARFDGTKFTVFDHTNTPEMGDDNNLNLAEDTEGYLWIGGWYRLLRKSGNRLQRWSVSEGLRVGIIFKICADRKKGVWVGSHGTVAHVADTILAQFANERGFDMNNGFSTAMQQDKTGVLWIGTLNGLFSFNSEKQWFEAADPAPRPSGHRIPVTGLQRSPQGDLWAMFTDPGPPTIMHGTNAWLGCFRSGRWERFSPLGAFDFNFTGDGFILADTLGNVWLPGPDVGIHRFRDGAFQFLHIAFPAHTAVVNCMREDHEGNLWMGTDSSGLWRWQPRRMRSYTTNEGLPHNAAWTLCAGPDGSVWIGTDGGVSRLRTGHFETWTERDGLSRNTVRALAVDRKGTVWIGTGTGLNSLQDGKLVQHPFPGEWFEGKIRAITPTRDGALWVAAATGLNRLEGDQRTKFTTADGLANDDVRALLEDSSRRLWIGTFGGGLQCYHENRFTTYMTNNGLSSGFVWALHEDKEGVLWVGTESGLNRLRDGRLTTFSTRHGLPGNLINFILEDDLGQLWISHDHGIYRVRRAALNDVADGRTNLVHCVSYTEADGLPSEETNGQKSYPAGCKTRDGRLWFPTTKGVVVIDPALHKEEQSPPRVVIEQVRATGNLIFSINPRDPLSGEREAAVELRGGEFQLPPGSGRVLEFDYTANTFVQVEKTRFRYRLLGMDERWIDVGTRREAYFTNLRPGKHQFEVIAANHHGVWQEGGAVFAFYLSPFFYQTWWFYLVCGLATTGLAVGFIVWRIRALRKLHRLEQQSAITDERVRIAKDLHDGLGADLTRLTMLADLATGESGMGSGEHLRKLSQFSRDATRELKELIWIANPANDTVDGLVSRICQNAEDFLGDARIRCRLDLSPHLPQQPLSLDQRRNLLLVAREALNNIVKHAAATEVCIRAHGGDENLHLAIEDNGRGFDSASVRPDGLGLASMRRRVENLGGSFILESRQGAGTKILITIKLGEPQ